MASFSFVTITKCKYFKICSVFKSRAVYSSLKQTKNDILQIEMHTKKRLDTSGWHVLSGENTVLECPLTFSNSP